MRAGVRDLVLVFEPNGIDPAALDGLDRTEICHDPLRVVLPVGHRLADGGAVELPALAGEPWVAPTDSCARLARGACAAAGFEPDVVFESGDYGAVQGFVAAGAGVALVPALAVTGGERTVSLPLAGDASPGRTIAALTAARRARPPAAGAMVAALLEAAPVLLAAGGEGRAVSV